MNNFPTIIYHKFLLSLFLTVLLFCPGINAQQQEAIIADNATLTLVSDQFSFTEGPATDQDGNVYFTDQPNDHIWKYSVDGELSLFMDQAGRSNGMYFDHEGNLLTAADENRQVWSISPEGQVTVLVNDFEGKRLNGPNDLWVNPNNGGVYITDPYYRRNYWEQPEQEIEEERVYYLTPDRQELIVVADHYVKPNGIIGTPDGRTLYVADIGDDKTYSYTINRDGTLSDKTLFAEMGSDGMTIDNLGNIYLTGTDGVTVFDRNGQQIEQIDIPQRWTANITFIGPERQTLFITASNAVYTLEMNVQGVD
jgi:gluconolactonase